MKISASIYSDSKRPLEVVIQDLVDHNVDLLHVDCNDDPRVFEDIQKIRSWCTLPIDLHIITPNPSKYMQLLLENPVEYVTFQYEDMVEELVFPEGITAKKGLAVITPTPVTVFEAYKDFDFILIMATIPGQSGGVFDAFNFSKIRSFKKLYPSKSIHVDGGVNAEVSFILRTMGVSSSVSGSYLFKAPSVGQALMNLTKRITESEYLVKDFMIPLDECPVVTSSMLSLENVLQSIEAGQLSFTLITNDAFQFRGIVSNADLRKGLLRNMSDLNSLEVEQIINTNAITVTEQTTVLEMLQMIKKCAFPILYIPVISSANQAVGIVTFNNLIKGEI